MLKKTVTVDTIKQYYLDVNERYKIEVLSRMMEVTAFKLGVVFCNTKRCVDEVCSALQQRGFLAEALHGDMKQLQRDSVMAKFRKGFVNVLVATDVAARGIDIDDIDVVFNYDVPTDEEYYVHRIGRTGRAMRQGLSYTLCAHEIVQNLDLFKITLNLKLKKLRFQQSKRLKKVNFFVYVMKSVRQLNQECQNVTKNALTIL